jgi:hypothetical protein
MVTNGTHCGRDRNGRHAFKKVLVNSPMNKNKQNFMDYRGSKYKVEIVDEE